MGAAAPFQMIVTRSEPPTPAPARTETLVGALAVPHRPGELLLPTRKMKSSAEMFGCEPDDVDHDAVDPLGVAGDVGKRGRTGIFPQIGRLVGGDGRIVGGVDGQVVTVVSSRGTRLVVEQMAAHYRRRRVVQHVVGVWANLLVQRISATVSKAVVGQNLRFAEQWHPGVIASVEGLCEQVGEHALNRSVGVNQVGHKGRCRRIDGGTLMQLDFNIADWDTVIKARLGPKHSVEHAPKVGDDDVFLLSQCFDPRIQLVDGVGHQLPLLGNVKYRLGVGRKSKIEGGRDDHLYAGRQNRVERRADVRKDAVYVRIDFRRSPRAAIDVVIYPVKRRDVVCRQSPGRHSRCRWE